MSATGIKKSYTNASVYNLALIFFTIFICPLFPPSYLAIVYPVCFSVIFILVALSIGKNRKYNLGASVGLIVLIWIGIATDAQILRGISRIMQFFFFLYLLIKMVSEIARNSKVNLQVIIDSITGYFLLGLTFSTLAILIGVAGQLYIAVIIAMLIGKFASRRTE